MRWLNKASQLSVFFDGEEHNAIEKATVLKPLTTSSVLVVKRYIEKRQYLYYLLQSFLIVLVMKLSQTIQSMHQNQNVRKLTACFKKFSTVSLNQFNWSVLKDRISGLYFYRAISMILDHKTIQEQNKMALSLINSLGDLSALPVIK